MASMEESNKELVEVIVKNEPISDSQSIPETRKATLRDNQANKLTNEYDTNK